MDTTGLEYLEAIERIRTKQDALENEIRLIEAENLNRPEITSLCKEQKDQLQVQKKSLEKRVIKKFDVTVADLPKDLVEEILCRVPATCLKQVRCCKLWDRLFKDDTNFARKHFDKAAKQFCLVLLTREATICPIRLNLLKGIVPSVDFLGSFRLANKFDISRVVHCDGLLLCSHYNESSVLVWNPLTGKTRFIDNPNLPKIGRNFVLGYSQNKISSSKSYKILSFLTEIPLFYGITGLQIYELNSNSWRKLGDVFERKAWCMTNSTNSVSLNGKPYWFAVERPDKYPICLVRFDFSQEKFEYVPLPYQTYFYSNAIISLVGDQKLSVLLQQGYSTKNEIWVTNKIDDETQVVTWSKVFALDPMTDIQISETGSFLLDEEKKVIVWCTKWHQKYKDMVYIVTEDNKVTSVDIKCLGCSPVILNYVPSLVHIEQAGGKRKRAD